MKYTFYCAYKFSKSSLRYNKFTEFFAILPLFNEYLTVFVSHRVVNALMRSAHSYRSYVICLLSLDASMVCQFVIACMLHGLQGGKGGGLVTCSIYGLYLTFTRWLLSVSHRVWSPFSPNLSISPVVPYWLFIQIEPAHATDC